MAGELKQLAESGFNRVLIICSPLNYRRSLAMVLSIPALVGDDLLQKLK